jgi:hypothetical protein
LPYFLFREHFRRLRLLLQVIFAQMGFRQHKEMKFLFQPLILVIGEVLSQKVERPIVLVGLA